MYDLEITDPAKIEVKTRKFSFSYAIDGTKENPLEATYAALAGCAGVYALKACKKRNLSPIGIKISGKPFMDRTNPAMITKWVTEISFPDSWSQDEKDFVINETQQCAVKEMIAQGTRIEFATEETKN